MSRDRTIAPGMRCVFLILPVLLASAFPLRAQVRPDDVQAPDSATPVAANSPLLPLLREVPDPVPGSCPASAAPAAIPVASTADRQESERLATEASNAAILGDLAAARDLLARAAALDPAEPNVAFRHARALEELGEPALAVGEYCRYLRLAPDAADAAEVAMVVQRIAPPVRPGIPDSAVADFQVALQHADAGRFAEAVHAFTAVAGSAPTWPVPWYNRGLVNAELRQRTAARADFERYLELDPDAASRATVRSWIAQLDVTEPRYSPGAAFMSGLIPGVGHFYTGRPAVGVLFLATAGGAAAAGLLIEERHVECLGNPQGGVCPPEQVRGERVERPHMMLGLGIAAAATIVGAIDAARGARSRNAREPILRFGSDVTSDRPGLLRPGIETTGSQLDLAFIRLQF